MNILEELGGVYGAMSEMKVITERRRQKRSGAGDERYGR